VKGHEGQAIDAEVVGDLAARSWLRRNRLGHRRAPRAAASSGLLCRLRRYNSSIAECRLRIAESEIRNPKSEMRSILLSCQSKYVAEFMNRST